MFSVPQRSVDPNINYGFTFNSAPKLGIFFEEIKTSLWPKRVIK